MESNKARTMSRLAHGPKAPSKKQRSTAQPTKSPITNPPSTRLWPILRLGTLTQTPNFSTSATMKQFRDSNSVLSPLTRCLKVRLSFVICLQTSALDLSIGASSESSMRALRRTLDLLDWLLSSWEMTWLQATAPTLLFFAIGRLSQRQQTPSTILPHAGPSTCVASM